MATKKTTSEADIEAVKADPIAEAEAKAAAIIAAAEAKAKDIAKAAAEAPKPKNGRVRIKLFRDNDKYQDDVFVGVNGKGYRIQRGVEVEVPAVVAEILEQSDVQGMALAKVIDEAQSDYAKSEKELN